MIYICSVKVNLLLHYMKVIHSPSNSALERKEFSCLQKNNRNKSFISRRRCIPSGVKTFASSSRRLQAGVASKSSQLDGRGHWKKGSIWPNIIPEISIHGFQTCWAQSRSHWDQQCAFKRDGCPVQNPTKWCYSPRGTKDSRGSYCHTQRLELEFVEGFTLGSR